MTLIEANEALERLENEENYWLDELELVLSTVMPKSTDIQPERVDGGKRVDKLAKYVETLEEKQIRETLDYIYKKKQNLIKWMDNELKTLKKYGEVTELIIHYKENKKIIDKYTGKVREMTWDEIAKEVHYSKSFCRTVYREYKKKRSIGE